MQDHLFLGVLSEEFSSSINFDCFGFSLQVKDFQNLYRLISSNYWLKKLQKIWKVKESIIESRNLTKINATSDQTLGLFLIIFILTLPARIEIVSSQKICQMTEFKTECNDLTKKKSILVWKQIGSFFRSSSFNASQPR